MTKDTALVTPVPAATLLLIRDGTSGLEVFMVQRHHQIEFATGALVFPGGKVDSADFDTRLRNRCINAERYSDLELGVRVGCLREAFEECGVLLAHEAERGELVSEERLKLLQPYRNLLEKGELRISDFLEQENLMLMPESLVPFAHWITPERMPKRFDTYFYVACAPEFQLAIHDGHESVDSLWITPAEGVAHGESGSRNIMFPTRLNLLKLGESRTVDEAMKAARASKVVTVCPVVRKDEQGHYLEIPVEAGYQESTQRLK